MPDRLADGAASGTPTASIIACATGCDGNLTATVSMPHVMVSDTLSVLRNIMVRGPGQNLFAMSTAASGTSATMPSSISMEEM